MGTLLIGVVEVVEKSLIMKFDWKQSCDYECHGSFLKAFLRFLSLYCACTLQDWDLEMAVFFSAVQISSF